MSLHLDALALARALGGEAFGSKVAAPGPGHSRRDRSLTVFLDAAAPDGFRVFSHAGDDWRACRDHVAAALGLPVGRRRQGGDPAPAPVCPPPAGQQDDGRRQQLAREIWQAGRDPRGTLVEVHLGLRALHLPDDVAGDVLRFHPACPWGTGNVPAMLAPLRCFRTGRIVGVHRTALTAQGAKTGRRMLGTAAGAAVMLDRHEDVTAGLVIGEGIETCMAARQLGLRPVWALGSAGAIAALPVLAGIEALTVLAETDDDGANERAVQAVGTRWAQAGAEVDLIQPRTGGDLNDALKGARTC